ncbi:acyl-CoA synthetase [Camelimonas abortus]|uniref:Acyl-CoA synthetase n=1 Tax=Camelimonas abortus TaxID=1017184 RepID=A0ABV7LEI3_9HYPH
MGWIISGERRIETAELLQRAARAATGFRQLGVQPGDTVAVYLRNDFAFFEASMGAGMVGAYSVPVNWHYTESEARYLFGNSEAKVIVIHADLLPGIRGAIPEGVPLFVVETPPEIRAAYNIPDERCVMPEGVTRWSDWLEQFPPATEQLEAPGSMIYTSGTTGNPKGVRRARPTPEQALTTQTVLSRAFGFYGRTDLGDLVTVVTGPMYHSAPNAYGTLLARLGANVILQPRYDSEELLRLIEKHRVTHLHMVPIMFNRLLRLPEEVRSKYDVSSLQFVVHAAAPVSPPIKRQMIEWWGPVINEYYGTTETGSVTFCTSEEWLKYPGTVGRPFPESTVKILDPQGNELPPGEIGEVAARTFGIADFTYQLDDEKRASSEKGRLILPGDVGYFNEDGYLFLCDRAKDMIISGGVNIYPAEIEAALQRMPGVADCAVFGVPDEEYGESVMAVVQPAPGADLTEEQVKTWLRGEIAGFKVPKKVEFRADLPREDSGKIFKRKLREPYWAGVGRQI